MVTRPNDTLNKVCVRVTRENGKETRYQSVYEWYRPPIKSLTVDTSRSMYKDKVERGRMLDTHQSTVCETSRTQGTVSCLSYRIRKLGRLSLLS